MEKSIPSPTINFRVQPPLDDWLADGGWQLLHLHVVDALTDNEDELAAKWQLDGPALAAAARGWTPGQRAALADAVTRSWRSTALDGPIQEVLQEVGLIAPGLEGR